MSVQDNQGYEKNVDEVPKYPENPMKFEGYGNIGEVSYIDQNRNAYMQPDPNYQRPNFQNVPYLAEDEAKAALADYVSEHCCYGKGPVNELKYTNLQSSSSYRYILETFTENRSTKYVNEPYLGQVIIHNGMPPPQPWDINVQPTSLFHSHKQYVEIPNTAQVEMCTDCRGIGSKICFFCSGRGGKPCSFCNGHGHKHDMHNHQETCFHCSGRGTNICTFCSGTGRDTCSNCKGGGKLKWYLRLEVKFTNHVNDFIKNSGDVPDDLLRTCATKTIFTEQNVRVYPITNFQENDVNQASQNLISSHGSKFSNSRILMQKHELNAIPITLCSYTWKEKPYTYYVYGIDNKVHAPDYPKKCCCVIL